MTDPLVTIMICAVLLAVAIKQFFKLSQANKGDSL